MHDPLAILALTAPELFERQRRHVAIETVGAHTRGMTVIDERVVIERPAANCDVLTWVDADLAFGMLVDAIATFTR